MHEVIHSITGKNDQAMILKLDMEKVYDRVSWLFLEKVLERFGLNKNWLKMIKLCISTPRFSILSNGEVTSYFESGRGLRQGDPISPYLFILMAESLGRALEKAREDLSLSRVKSITHHQFVDDTILIGKATKQEAKKYKQILSTYEKASHQRIDTSKTKLFGLNLFDKKTKQLARIFSCQIGDLPTTYLGLPLFNGRLTKNYWEGFI